MAPIVPAPANLVNLRAYSGGGHEQTHLEPRLGICPALAEVAGVTVLL